MKDFKEQILAIKKEYDSDVAGIRRERLKNEWKGKKIILYGAGTLSGFVMNALEDYDVSIDGFADTYVSGTHKMTGLPIISAKELKENYSDAVVIITSEQHGSSIFGTLMDIEFDADRIYSFDDLLCFYTIKYEEFEPFLAGYEWAYNYYEDETSKSVVIDAIRTRLLGSQMTPSDSPQYFEPDICPLTKEEVFVDGGCFIGDTAEVFIRQTGGYRHIYGFEPEEGNYKKAIANLSKYENIDVEQGGLWHMTNTMRFISGEFGNSRFSEEGDVIEKSFGIDDYFMDKDDKPTFIKMDIEGAERMAIDGAAHTIKTYRPKLAICVYHKIGDMYELPKRILYHNPDYKLTLRHYSRWYAESVCYAVSRTLC